MKLFTLLMSLFVQFSAFAQMDNRNWVERNFSVYVRNHNTEISIADGDYYRPKADCTAVYNYLDVLLKDFVKSQGFDDQSILSEDRTYSNYGRGYGCGYRYKSTDEKLKFHLCRAEHKVRYVSKVLCDEDNANCSRESVPDQTPCLLHYNELVASKKAFFPVYYVPSVGLLDVAKCHISWVVLDEKNCSK